MSLVKAAVVGVGHLGRYHSQKLVALKDKVEFLGLFDLDGKRLQEVAAELKVPVFSSLEEVAQKAEAVIVASSTPSHYEVCKALLTAGRHVLVEKPVTQTSREAEELCRLAEEKKLVFQVGHVERFNPALRSVRKKLKDPLFIECHRLAPFKVRSTEVDVVLDLMIHDLDVILSLIQSPPKSVSAVGTPVLTKKIDIANARIEFENGAVANVTASRVSQNTQRKFRVFQQNQYLSIDFQSGEVNLLTKTGEWNEQELPIEAEAFSLEKGDALMDEVGSFIDAVKEGGAPLVSGRDGMKALKLAEEILEDAERRLS
jgi:predicted dehydrogenase